MFTIPEKADKLPPGGVKLKILNFNGGTIQKELLQPECYRIASTNEKWYPPSLHKKFIEKFKSVMGQKLLEQKATKDTMLEQQRREGRAKRAETTAETKSTGRGGVAASMEPLWRK